MSRISTGRTAGPHADRAPAPCIPRPTPGPGAHEAATLTQVWGYDAYDPNLVEVHVSALRRKLEEHGPRVLETVRGLGYRLVGL